MNKLDILFVIDALRKGGIRTSLLNLLANLDYSKYNVYLLCFHITEEDLSNLPYQVHIIHPNKLFDIIASTGDEVREKSFLSYLLRLFFSILSILLNSDIIYKYVFKTEKRTFDFDVAISYTNNVSDHSLYFGCNKFVIEKVNACKKITWLHADYEKMCLNTTINNEEYNFFDKIITVSDETSKKFLTYNTHLKNKVFTIYNLIDESQLLNKSNEPILENFSNDILNIITVSRLDDNKDPNKIIEIVKILKEKNYKFIWRVIGDGPLLKEMVNKTKKENLEDFIVWYGFLNNPYPYLRKSNLYISTSKSEGYSLSIKESLFFSVPVLAGTYDSIYEILSDDSGWVVENTVESYIELLSKIFSDITLLENKCNTISIKHNNKYLLEKFHEVIYE